MKPESADTRRELLEELDSLSAALESAWQEIIPGEDPRIPVLSEVIEVSVASQAGGPCSTPDSATDDPSVVHDDTMAILVDELLARWLPVIEAELRARLQQHVPAVAPRDRADPALTLPGDAAPT